MYPLLGCSLEGALWFNFFAATGEFFYHSSFKSPRWLKYFIQTPELHSVHHKLDVHRYNFADLPIWDRIFGTYRDTDSFAPACGFPNHNEPHLGTCCCSATFTIMAATGPARPRGTVRLPALASSPERL